MGVDQQLEQKRQQEWLDRAIRKQKEIIALSERNLLEARNMLKRFVDMRKQEK